MGGYFSGSKQCTFKKISTSKTFFFLKLAKEGRNFTANQRWNFASESGTSWRCKEGFSTKLSQFFLFEDFDLFGDEDSDDEEKKRVTEERLKAYAEKKSKKPGPIAKSNVIYDVKPWDDTIDIKEIEENVRSIQCDGLVWGASKILPVAFGVQKLQVEKTIYN